jgi:membrane-associated protease RseP (regulator of RpoE activity)
LSEPPAPSSSLDVPEVPQYSFPVIDGNYAPPAPRPRFQASVWLHVTLFLLTLGTTTLVGALHYYSFISALSGPPAKQSLVAFLVRGLWYSIGILLILGSHEMGHYLMCRRYNTDASLPYFLPFLIPAPIFQTGTLGAVIRIREPFATRKVLFDIGIAGPIAGFVVLVPLLFAGLWMSSVMPSPTEGVGVYLGEPLLFKWAVHLVFGSLPDSQALNAHPLVFAAWFGMLATALNLLPFGQLDGGHITYATLDHLSTPISLVTVAFAVAMTFVSRSWMVMTLVMLVMLWMLGPRHPRVLREYEPLGPGRTALAVFALVMLVLCFTPAPIEPFELLKH